LEIKHCSNITLVGWQSLATALASLDNLEDVSIYLFVDGDEVLLNSDSGMLLLNTFIPKPFIRRVRFPVSTFAEIQVIADVIGCPNCIMEELTMDYHHDHRNVPRQAEREQLTQALVNALQSNKSLKILRIYPESQPLLHWPLMSNILCNTSSVDATVQSNHTLEFVYEDYGDQVPNDILSILHMNQNANKQSVIREKILRNHNLIRLTLFRHLCRLSFLG
jgi:hypothetical protein